MAIPGRLKIYKDGQWKYTGYGPEGASGASGYSGQSASAISRTATIVLSAPGGIPATTSGCAPPAQSETSSNDINYVTLDFDQTTSEIAFWNIIMPGGYDSGVLKATFYWTASAGTATQTCTWGIQARAFTDHDALDQAPSTAVTVTDSLLAVGDVHVSDVSADITPLGTPGPDKMMTFKVYRDTSDTLAADAKLLFVKIEYTSAYSD